MVKKASSRPKICPEACPARDVFFASALFPCAEVKLATSLEYKMVINEQERIYLLPTMTRIIKDDSENQC